MPRQIDPQTLEQISGRAQLSATSELLDNTLATMSHRAKMKESQQLGQLRSVQIQQATQEQLEFMQSATVRDTQRKVLEKESDAALKFADENIQLKQEGKRAQAATADLEGVQSAMGLILSAPDSQAAKVQVDKYASILPEAFQKEIQTVKHGTPEYEAVVSRWIQDVPFLQKKALAAAKAKGAGGGKLTTGSSVQAVATGLENRGVQADDALLVSATASGIKDILNKNYSIETHHAQVALFMTKLYQDNPERYEVTDPTSGVGGFFQSQNMDIDGLQRDTIAAIAQNPNVLAGIQSPESEQPPPSDTLSEADIKAAMDQYDVSREYVIEQWKAQNK